MRVGEISQNQIVLKSLELNRSECAEHMLKESGSACVGHEVLLEAGLLEAFVENFASPPFLPRSKCSGPWLAKV